MFIPYLEHLDGLKRAELIARDLNDSARLARALYWTGRVHIAQGHAFHSIAPLAEGLAPDNYRRNQMATYLAHTLGTCAQVYTQQARRAEAEKAHAEARQWQQSQAPPAEEVASGS